MRFSLGSALVVALAAQNTVASTWFSKAVYNKWHETELERWLSDHNVPYPTPADRNDLEVLVKRNWNDKVVKPYNEWDTPQLQQYLKFHGEEARKGTESNRDALVSQVKESWTDNENSASDAYGNVRDWIFDSWTESQLKAFLDKNGIPSPSPRKRDDLLTAARSNYETVAKKLKETSQYPGDWLYASWAESELKQFLDERGIPAPQPSTKDKLIASVRRNSRQASLSLKAAQESASSSASVAQESLTDALLDAWSDSKIKEWADKNGIKVPQGSKRNELIAIARKHRAQLIGDHPLSSVSSAYGAATTKAGNEYAKAADGASSSVDDLFDQAVGTWSDSRLKAYLDARGVPAPQGTKKDELVAKVRLHKHKAATGYSAWTFDTWTTENIRKWLNTQNNKVAKKSGASRDDLLKQAQDSYAKASKSGGSNYASVTSYFATQTDAAKDSVFDTWSESELKNFLDSYGAYAYQGNNVNELRAAARRQATYFRYGTTSPPETLWAKFQDNINWVLGQLKIGASAGRNEAGIQVDKAGTKAKEGGAAASSRASEAAQKASDKAKEEL